MIGQKVLVILGLKIKNKLMFEFLKFQFKVIFLYIVVNECGSNRIF